jgi:hypothetical protein
MKARQLYVLGAIVVVLLAIKLIVSRHDRHVADDLTEAGIRRLLPDSLTAKDVRWVRVSTPAEGRDVKSVRVARAAASDWVVASSQDAPADGSAVNGFVEAAVALAGEERGAGKDHFAEFGVDEAHAVKVELGTTDAEKPAATLWLGKAGDRPNAQFVRVEGSDAVSHAGDGLRGALGLWGDAAKLDADHWLKKNVLTVDGASIKSIDVERPDARYAFAQNAAPAPEPAKPPAEPGKDAAPPAPPAREWVVAAPAGLAWPARKDALAGTLGRVGTVRVDGVAPPEACAASMDSLVKITEDGGATHEIKFGGAIQDKNDVAVQVSGDPHCYRMSTYNVSGIAPRASSVFDVPAVFKDAPAAKDVKNVAYTRDGVTVHMAQAEESKWTLQSPDHGNADASRATELVGAVTGLRVDDLAEASRVPAALLKPAATVTLQASGKTLTVAVLGKRLGGIGEERYVRIQGGAAVPAGYVAVVPDSVARSLLPTPKELKGSS